MEKEKIAELFMKGIDCSQVVEGAFAEELGSHRKKHISGRRIWRRNGNGETAVQ